MHTAFNSSCQDDSRSQILNKYLGNPEAIIDFCTSHGWEAKRAGEELAIRNNARGEKHASIGYNIQSGMWIDRADGDYRGDLFALLGLVLGYDPKREFRQLLEALGATGSYTPTPRPRLLPKPPPTEPTKPLEPFPPGVTPPRQPNENGRWVYRDKNSLVIMMVIRCELENGKKIVKPWTCINGKLVNKMASKPRPIYNLDLLHQRPTDKVLVVEGEKCAEAAQSALPDGWVATTWPSGTGAVGYADWSPLKGRDVTIWPDADDVGVKAAEAVRSHVPGAKILSIRGRPKGWDVADAVEEGEDIMELIQQQSKVVEMQQEQDWPDVTYYQNGNVKILATVDNIAHMLKLAGWRLRWNDMRSIEELTINGHKITDGDDIYSEVLSECQRRGVPSQNLNGFLYTVANREKYHPMAEWVDSKPWDGVDRITELYSTVHEREGFEEAKEKYLRNFLIANITAAFAKEETLFKTVLILHGVQGGSKSTWLYNLFPKDCFWSGAKIDFSNKDHIISLSNHLCVELAEIEATLKRGTVAHFKAYTGTRADEFRRPYARAAIRKPRRTVLCGSSNQDQFLYDKTGNVRFQVISATKLDHERQSQIDMQQLWAQVKAQLLGEKWWFEDSELDEQEALTERFVVEDPVEQAIRDAFCWNSARDTKMSWVQILRAAGIKYPRSSHASLVKRVMAEYGIEQHRAKQERYYLVPATHALPLN